MDNEQLNNGLPIQQDARTIDCMRKFNSKNDLAQEAGFANLLAYCAEHGTALVPKGHHRLNGYENVRWVYWQKSNLDRLTPEQKAQLETVPSCWVWNAKMLSL